MEIEKEYKYLVSAEQFQALLSKCNEKYPFFKNKLQANYYYDTEDNALNNAKTTVRIRQHHSDMKLQIKKHRQYNGGLSTSEEYSAKIDTLPSALRIPDVSNGLQLKGALFTERRTFSFGQNSIICFDYNMYLGNCDYEIEIEVDEVDRGSVLAVIKYLGLTKEPTVSKCERFFERLEAIRIENQLVFI